MRLSIGSRLVGAGLFSALVGLSTGLSGCVELHYLAHLGVGELGVQGGAEPIEAVLNSGRLTDEEGEQLRRAVRARDFAGEVIGLSVGDSYQMFYDSGDDPSQWSLSVSEATRAAPITWDFPIVGTSESLSFYDEELLNYYAARFDQTGYDVYTYEVAAYSTLGILNDPVRSTMLGYGPITLAEVMIHELTHNTIFRPGDPVFNESLATYVGRTGAIQFLAVEFGADSGWPETAAAYYADSDRVDAFMISFYESLVDYYAQPLGELALLRGRAAFFAAAGERFASEVQPELFYPELFSRYTNLPVNNAWVLLNRRYGFDLDVFAAVHAATGFEWSATLDVFRGAAGASGSPFDYLRDWLAANAGS